MKLIALALCVLGGLASVSARADSSCYSGDLVIDRWEYWDFSKNTRSAFWLPTRVKAGSSGLRQTHAAAQLEWNGALNVGFSHQLPDGQVGLDYTIFRADVQIGSDRDSDKFLYSADLTNNCEDTGVSLFSGQAYHLSPAKVPARKDGRARGIELVHIRIWGHL